MRRHCIRALAGRRFKPCTTNSHHNLPIAPTLLQQEFVAAATNRVWLSDITYIATGDGWLYLPAVLDLATRKIIGWAMRDHMRTELPLGALMMAAQRQRPAEGLVCHSGSRQPICVRGIWEANHCNESQAFDEPDGLLLRSCAHESFFHNLKVELVHQRRWATREDARRDLFAYIEDYYNLRRIHYALGYRTTEQAERQMA
jgi:transposase InsO family protein